MKFAVLLCTFLTQLQAQAALHISVISETSEPIVLTSARLLDVGFVPYGGFAYGLLREWEDCGEGCEAEGEIVMVDISQREGDWKPEIAERKGAIAVLLYQARNCQILEEKTLPVSIPVMEISGEEAEMLKAERLPVQLNITFSLQRGNGPTIALVVSMEKNTIFETLVNLVKAHNLEEDFKLYYEIDKNQCRQQENRCESSREVVRQKCVERLKGTAGLIAYLEQWIEACEMRTSEVCLEGLLAANVTTEYAEGCIGNRFDSILEEVIEESESIGETAPAVLLWGQRYHGLMTRGGLERAICSISSDSLSVCSELMCSPGCWPELLSNSYCDSVCDTSECHFDNYACRSRPSPRFLNDTVIECSRGCIPWMLTDQVCHKKCDNQACNYNNWVCRCAAGCPPSLLNNHECDLACNSSRCSYDKAQCLTYTASPAPLTPDTIVTNTSGSSTTSMSSSEAIISSSTSNSNSMWLIAIFVACAGVCCMASLVFLVLIIVRKMKSYDARRIAAPPSNVIFREPPPDLARQLFTPGIVDYGLVSCSICLSDFRKGEEVVKTVCKHLFHYECITTWTKHNLECPICKKHLVAVLTETVNVGSDEAGANMFEQRQSARPLMV